MLLRQIKSESYGVLRYKPFRPSLSASLAEYQQVTKLHPVLHPFSCKLGVFLHPLPNHGIPNSEGSSCSFLQTLRSQVRHVWRSTP